jgi:5'(3')-deoxyribonucleotidase
MSLIIACDMDGTIADWTKAACQRAKKIFDINIKYEDIKNPIFGDIIREKLIEKGKNVDDISNKDLYSKLYGENFYLNLEPLPGAIKAITDIYEMGHRIIFLTKPTKWDKTPEQKSEWLEIWFSHIKYSLIMVSDMKDKHLINVPVIIDDDPRALKDHPVAIPICIAHPWNEEFRKSGEVGLVEIKHLDELPEQIKFIDKILGEEKSILI